jgi:glutathione S-transferase
MMLLRTSIASPFGRKCWLAAVQLGLRERVQLRDANFRDLADVLHRENPLGKMPVLRTEDGELLHDSAVIVEYLDHVAGAGSLIPSEWPARGHELRLQSVADGIIEAGVLIVFEGRMRPRAQWSREWLEFQRGKIHRGFAEVVHALPDTGAIRIGAIALACALGFIERRGQLDWRGNFPALRAWLDAFRAAVPEYDATHLPPEPGYESP